MVLRALFSEQKPFSNLRNDKDNLKEHFEKLIENEQYRPEIPQEWKEEEKPQKKISEMMTIPISISSLFHFTSSILLASILMIQTLGTSTLETFYSFISKIESFGMFLNTKRSSIVYRKIRFLNRKNPRTHTIRIQGSSSLNKSHPNGRVGGIHRVRYGFSPTIQSGTSFIISPSTLSCIDLIFKYLRSDSA